MPPVFYFAWCGPLDAWGPVMLREDEEIFAIQMGQVEGGFPTLQIDLKNPRVGLLAAARNVWCWLSYTPDPLVPAFPIFRGRLLGVPQNLQDEVVRLEFIARPQDYQAQKVALAQSLQVAPFWAPEWVLTKIADPDTVLESRPQHWHIDRVTLGVTVSDIIEGEDGTVDVTAADHFYDAMTITYGQTPLRQVDVTGTVTWDQTGAGSADLTPALVAAFQASGSPLPSPLICSLTGDGLYNSWPAPGTGIGGGWSIGLDSSAQLADWIKPAFLTKTWVAQDVFPLPPSLPAAGGVIPPPAPASSWTVPSVWEFPITGAMFPITGPGFAPLPPLKVFACVFPVAAMTVRFTADYTALRKRSETVTFSLAADVQAIVTDPGQAELETINLSTAAISQALDPGAGGSLLPPLRDPRQSTFFKTARGTQSFEYLLMLARAKLLARARCVLIKFVTSWDFVIAWISCRYSVQLFDPRLPGGVAIGKITGYALTYSDAGIAAEVTIGCTVGHGGTVAAAPGVPGYAAPGYVAAGYQSLAGGTIAAVPGQVAYLGFSNYTIIDDGLDLYNMTASNVLQPTPAVSLVTVGDMTAGNPKLSNLGSTAGLVSGSTYSISGAFIPAGATFVYSGSGAGALSAAPGFSATGVTVAITGAAQNGVTITNGLADQANIVSAAAQVKMMPDPVAALKAAPTRVCLDLVSCAGGAFNTAFAMQVQTMTVPKTIDLEAP